MVELAEVSDPALVGNATMAALDLRDQTAAEPAALLRSYLADKDLLLVVDNCEHVLDAAAELIAEVLGAAPGVRVIATSREPLAVAGEHVLPVPPLSLPTAAETLGQLRQNEAVQLFVERAAAVRTRALTAEQILDRLSDRFNLLAGAGRAALPRHQTLRTAIEWSYDLLAPAERTLLARLSVFAGRFTIADIEAVCCGDDLPAANALDVMSSLLDKSLATKEDAARVACYRLHETMREYAHLKLEPDGGALEERFADHYLGRRQRFAEQGRYRLREWLAWMEPEIDNVRALLRRFADRGDTVRGIALATSLIWYWVTRATTEGARWLDTFLETHPATAVRLALGDGAPRTVTGRHNKETGGLLGQREVDVARLVAEGLSNKAIGARLFISERTVESHVRNILNKLGFNTRAQIAGWMAEPES
jgi:predicted ATPase/DNA-binding CsgD family transcriptional regulator